MKKEDIRTTRTKKALKKAISKLMLDESIEDISVTDICKEAKINRVTFYTHYQDKHELLYELLHDIADLIDRENQIYYLQNKVGDYIKDYTNTISHSIYKICVENKKIIRSLSKQENTVLITMIEEIIVKEGLKTIDKLNENIKCKFPPKFIIKFLLGGFNKLIFEYAITENDLSEEEFFEYFDNLFYSLLSNKIFFDTI
jgi:AcrR family transcriptional regulator